MNAIAARHEQPTRADIHAWLSHLRARYSYLVANTTTLHDSIAVAHLGAKLSEFLALASAETIDARDAALLPRLAMWVTARLDALERAPAVQPLSLPLAPVPDERRAAALSQAVLSYCDAFGTAPGHITVRRLDALLVRYPLSALADALAICARREGHLHWPVLHALLEARTPGPSD